jgi:hypothetical protein
MIKSSKNVTQQVKEAVQALLLTTGKVLGTEGHRTALRHKSVTAAMHYGYAAIFLTPNLADGRAALVVNLHVGERTNHSDGMETFRLNLLDEKPCMPTLEKCMTIIATDSVAQAKYFDLIMRSFFEHLLGTTPPLKKEYLLSDDFRKHEDDYASTCLGGVLGDVACITGPIETQSRGSQHPHCLITLLGHNALDRLRNLPFQLQGNELVEQVAQWNTLVLAAASRIQYCSQETLARQLHERTLPTPLTSQVREAAGVMYADAPLQPREDPPRQYQPPQPRDRK